MDDVRINGQAYDANLTITPARMLPGGVLVAGDWIEQMIARGFGWLVNVGAFSTPITGGGAGDVLDLDQPEGLISVPSGYTIRPIRVSVECQLPLSAADNDENEILIGVDRSQKWDGNGTNSAETAFNLRTDITAVCPATCTSAFSGNITATPVLGMELARAVSLVDYVGTPATANQRELKLLYEPKNPPFIVGPAMLLVYFGGTVATPGFAEIAFVAFPTSLISNLQ